MLKACSLKRRSREPVEPLRDGPRGRPSQSLSFALDGNSWSLAPSCFSCLAGNEVNGFALSYTLALSWSHRV